MDSQFPIDSCIESMAASTPRFVLDEVIQEAAEPT